MSLRSKTINLGAGPSPLPEDVLHEAAAGLLDYQGLGMGLTEISHRSSTFQSLNTSCQSRLRSLLSIPEEFKIVFMQGGGLTQFSATVLNLVAAHRIKYKTGRDEDVGAEYVVTGSWGAKSAGEARRLGVKVQVVTDARTSSQDGKTFGSIPDPKTWSWSPDTATVDPMASAQGKEEVPAPSTSSSSTTERLKTPPAFIYYCDNETVNGVEFPSPGFPISSIPSSHRDVPLVADMSSNILSRPIPPELWSRLGIVFAGAQKNMGPSGATIVIVRQDLVVDLDEAVKYGGDRVPSMLWYKNMVDNDSLYNTPPMFPIYVCDLVFARLQSNGGVEEMTRVNEEKAGKVYGVLDGSEGFYEPQVERNARSRMNVVFTIRGGKAIEEAFVKEADAIGIKQIKGHRCVSRATEFGSDSAD